MSDEACDEASTHMPDESYQIRVEVYLGDGIDKYFMTSASRGYYRENEWRLELSYATLL